MHEIASILSLVLPPIKLLKHLSFILFWFQCWILLFTFLDLSLHSKDHLMACLKMYEKYIYNNLVTWGEGKIKVCHTSWGKIIEISNSCITIAKISILTDCCDLSYHVTVPCDIHIHNFHSRPRTCHRNTSQESTKIASITSVSRR